MDGRGFRVGGRRRRRRSRVLPLMGMIRSNDSEIDELREEKRLMLPEITHLKLKTFLCLA